MASSCRRCEATESVSGQASRRDQVRYQGRTLSGVRLGGGLLLELLGRLGVVLALDSLLRSSLAGVRSTADANDRGGYEGRRGREDG